MNASTNRRWLLANIAGGASAQLVFGVIADSGWVGEPKLLNVFAHLVGLLAAGALLAFLLRRAIGARHTPFVEWAALIGTVQFLAFGVAYETIGPPFDFVANVIALGATLGYLLRREARAANRPHQRRLVIKGALAGVGAVAGLVPVFLIAGAIDTALGGGLPPFLVILSLIGAVTGLVLGLLIRPVRGVPAVPLLGDPSRGTPQLRDYPIARR
jgi:hypothetical protein